MPNARLIYLFEQYLAKTCTVAEKQELAEMVLVSQHDKDVQDLMLQAWDTIDINEIMPEEKAEKIFDSIIDSDKEAGSYKMERGAKIRKLWLRAAAVAACGILIIGLGWYFLFNTRENAKTKEFAQVHDVKPPAKNRATITLANGQVVYLDSVNNGTLAQQSNVNLQKLGDGQIVYHGISTSLNVVYNTLVNPKGSKVIDITLNDGSKVWLNAGSSLVYPVAFAGNERKVTITGEAYFEVAKNAKMPFRVKINESTEVEVLGTHFNINAYTDEASINTTLLEGSVRVTASKKIQLLSPGQQAQVNANAINLIKNADVAQAVAWKDGLFSFTDANLPAVMRQLARWYDIEVKYEGAIPEREFNGEISKTLTLNQVLRILSKTRVNYRMESGNKITIIP